MRIGQTARILQVLLRPDVLFSIATFQSLTPYLFWPLGVGAAVQSVQLSYLPIIIILTGWISFLVGGAMVWTKLAAAPQFVLFLKERTIRQLIWILCLAGFAQVYFVVRIYGALPILSYLRGDNEIDVTTATVLQQDSFVGQFALLVLTSTVLGGLLLELALIAVETRKKVPWMFYVGLLSTLSITLINGKRVGMVRLAVLFLAGLLLHGGDVLRNLTFLIPFIKSKKFALFAAAGILIGMYSLFGPLAELRNQGRVTQTSGGEFIVYQQGPILNMEEQTRRAGLGPDTIRLLGPMQALLPIKLVPEATFLTNPPRIDPTSPSGFYELIQWDWGMPGVVFFPAIVGALCMWLYKSSRCQASYFLCYCQVTFSLLVAHSFNEFLIAPLVLVPCICFWILGTWTGTKIRVPVPVNRFI